MPLAPILLLLAACASATPGPAPSQPAGHGAAWILALPSAAGIPRAQPGREEVILATTTSTQDSGLLDVLVPLFERQTGYRVKPIAVGTGQALALGARGEADVLLVHAPEAERAWMAEGNGTARLLVMHNDFVLLGPRDDPAQVRSAASAEDAFGRIARAAALFVSRGDDSGTHRLEQSLWRAADQDPRGRSWYQEAGQGMGTTLTIADEKRAYTLSDRGTYLARQRTLQLAVLLEGARSLLNPYHVMPVNSRKFPKANAAGGEAFAAFLVSREAQTVIASFGADKFGQPLFFADGGRAEPASGG